MREYQVQKGDTLSAIGKKFRVPYSDIARLNPIIKDPDKIQAGWELKIPTSLSEIKAARAVSERIEALAPLKETKEKAAEAKASLKALQLETLERMRATEPKVSILKETILGLPKATKTVFTGIFSQPQYKLVAEISRPIIRSIQNLIRIGTPSTEELKKAKEKVDKLKLLDLPPEIRAKEIRRIIEEIKLR